MTKTFFLALASAAPLLFACSSDSPIFQVFADGEKLYDSGVLTGVNQRCGPSTST